MKYVPHNTPNSKWTCIIEYMFYYMQLNRILINPFVEKEMNMLCEWKEDKDRERREREKTNEEDEKKMKYLPEYFYISYIYIFFIFQNKIKKICIEYKPKLIRTTQCWSKRHYMLFDIVNVVIFSSLYFILFISGSLGLKYLRA